MASHRHTTTLECRPRREHYKFIRFVRNVQAKAGTGTVVQNHEIMIPTSSEFKPRSQRNLALVRWNRDCSHMQAKATPACWHYCGGIERNTMVLPVSTTVAEHVRTSVAEEIRVPVARWMLIANLAVEHLLQCRQKRGRRCTWTPRGYPCIKQRAVIRTRDLCAKPKSIVRTSVSPACGCWCACPEPE